MYKISVFIPEDFKEAVKLAMFKAGAGRIGNYDCCCFESLGQGQFRPLPGSRPYLGHEGKIEFVKEFKVEMVCEDSLLAAVVANMKEAHPYETPAYEVFELRSI